MARRQHLTVTLILAVVLFFSISYFFSEAPSRAVNQPDVLPQTGKASAREANPQGSVRGASADDGGFKINLDDLPLVDGDSIAPKLENATLKAELGRATWRFLHTMVARFPEKPTPDERKTLETFIHLFGRLYPCGDCARHFREILAKYPPQTSSRNSAAGWLCYAHNLVNERLQKPVFDCNMIGDFYDCGCGDDDKKKEKKTAESHKDV